jgi:hypothetical protein
MKTGTFLIKPTSLVAVWAIITAETVETRKAESKLLTLPLKILFHLAHS